MSRKSFAETIGHSQLLIKALKERNDNLPVGVTAELRDELDAINTKAFNANAEQEKLKAQLKEKTAEVDKYVSDIEQKYAYIKKYVKMGVPQELWREFGIEDKK